MSQLTEFFDGSDGKDSEGRTLEDILAFTNDRLEWQHDWVQWLFPLPEPSNYNPDAPRLTMEDLRVFRPGGAA